MGTMRGGMGMGMRAERSPQGRGARAGQVDVPKKKPELKKIWPQVRALWRPGKPEQGAADQVVDGSSLGSNIAYRGVVRHSCGSALVTKSLTVYLAPRQRHGCDACVASVFVIDRRGRALIYWLN